MTDIATVYTNDGTIIGGDWSLVQGSLLTDEGLGTAVIHSLFTWARAREDDPLPDPEGGRRGWWGSLLTEIPNDNYGSLLWLLSREIQTQETLNRAETYAYEALKWLLTHEVDGVKVASKIEVKASWLSSIMMGLQVTIHRPRGRKFNGELGWLWRETGAL